jgi:TonB-dependent SusC/RagA subfamily outer membrane receptor
MSKLFLHIEEPCTQNWDAMAYTENGRFCNRCKKEVIDFTNLSNNQIVQYFNTNTSEKICGRFKDTQLNNWIYESKLKSTNPALYKYFLSFILFTAGNNLQAQEIKKPALTIIDSKSNSKKNGIEIKKDSTQCSPINKQIFEDVKITLGGVRRVQPKADPLLIIDGKVEPNKILNTLNPNQIVSVDILKSSAAIALYGPDGVNGAIIIKTKNCKETEVSSTIL